MICSICIATYKRPELLDRLLTSLLGQVLPDGVNIQTIIVDNDAEESALPVFRTYHDTERVTFEYFIQPVRNISLTRNMGVSNATGTYHLFIDDDEIAPPDWVAKLLRAVSEYRADGVFGPVFPMFDDAAPAWIRKGERLFIGTIPTTPSGSEAVATWSGNCLLAASLLRRVPGPFDPAYGITGGEDTELFDKLKCKGARFVYCNEAPVFERWPAARTRVSYLIKSSLKGGNAHTRRTIAVSRRTTVVRSFMLLKALSFGLLSAILIIGAFPSKVWRVYWELKFASNVGRLLAVFGQHYKGYK